MPVGQLAPDEPADPPAFAENVEKTFSVRPEPHFSHACFFLLPAFSRNDVTCPHALHRYSKIGMVLPFQVMASVDSLRVLRSAGSMASSARKAVTAASAPQPEQPTTTSC